MVYDGLAQVLGSGFGALVFFTSIARKIRHRMPERASQNYRA